MPLLGHPRTIGEAFHITSDDVLTWNQIAEALAAAAGVEARIVHVPSDAIAAADPDWGAGLLGDKAHSMVFDNSKLRTVVPDYVATIPFEQGAREIVAWHDEDPSRQRVDPRLDALMDRLVETYRVDPAAETRLPYEEESTRASTAARTTWAFCPRPGSPGPYGRTRPVRAARRSRFLTAGHHV